MGADDAAKLEAEEGGEDGREGGEQAVGVVWQLPAEETNKRLVGDIKQAEAAGD